MRSGSLTDDERLTAVDRAIALCERENGTIDIMADFVLVHSYWRVWAVFPDREVEITPDRITSGQSPSRTSAFAPRPSVSKPLPCSARCYQRGTCMPEKMVPRA